MVVGYARTSTLEQEVGLEAQERGRSSTLAAEVSKAWASPHAHASNLPQRCGSWRRKGRTRSRAPGPAYEGQKGAIMPNEESKSGEQKIAEAEVERFRKELGPFVVAAETTRMAMVFTA